MAPSPSSTPSPSAIPTSAVTATPAPPRPWLLAFNHNGVRLVDARGSDIARLNAPPPWDPEVDLRPDRGISPHGWVAYRVSEEVEDSGNPSLAIFQLPQPEPVAMFPLLSPRLQASRVEPPDPGEPPSADDDVYLALSGLWFKPRWSPDGRYLAFTAALDGTSTDVYIYDTSTETTKRLTDEPQQVMLLGWSPDSRWILYGETYQYGTFQEGYITRHVRAASLTDGDVRELLIAKEASRVKLVEWMSATSFLLAEISNETGPLSLILCDLSNGRITRLYDEGFTWAAVDPHSGAIAYSSWIFGPEPGLFIFPPGEERAKRVVDEMGSFYWGLISWSPELGLFFAESDHGITSFGIDGSVRELYPEHFCLPVVSPDGRWMAFGACSQEMSFSPFLRIYDRSNDLVVELTGMEIVDIIWQEDSHGLIYRDASAEPSSYHLSLPDGTQTPVASLDDLDLVEVPMREGDISAEYIELDESFPTPFPTPIAESALSAAGPWWIGSTGGNLVAFNQDGNARVPLTTKRPWVPSADLHSSAGISSSGLVGIRVSTAWTNEPPLDLALMVYSLPRTTPSLDLPLFSTDLQATMESMMDFQYEDGPQIAGPRWQYEPVYQSVLTETSRIAWSKDGRFLAFPAALDGTTSDLYLFDSDSGEIRRLTRETENVDLLGWSPQDDMLIYATVSHPVISHGGVSGFWISGVYAVGKDGGGRRLLYRDGAIENIAGWFSDQVFLVESWSGGPRPPFRIRSFDIANRQVDWSFEGEIYDIAVSPEKGSLAFTAQPGQNEGEKPQPTALFLYESGSESERQAAFNEPAPAYPHLLMWSPALELFLASSADGVFSFTPTGEIQFRYPDEQDLPSVSPDGRWLVFETPKWDGPDDMSGMRIYPARGGVPLKITENKVLTSAWLADSETLLYLEEVGVFTRLFSVHMPDTQADLLHPEFELRVPVLIQTN